MNTLAKIAVLAMTICFATKAVAIKDDFIKSLSNIGYSINVTDPEIIKDQQAGFATGGSIIMRGNIQNKQLGVVELPSVRAGCGGIDLFGGGFGYITSKEIKMLLNSIAQNALAYSVQLAVDTVSPQMGNIMKNVESMARFINSQNINSCQTAALLVSGMWPKSEQSEKLACQARQMGGNVVSDYFAARDSCTGEKSVSINKSRSKDEELSLSSVLGSEYNLVWKALKKKGVNDSDTISMLMSISGTYISRVNGNKVIGDYRPSLALKGNILKALMYGDNEHVNIYACRDLECLELIDKPLVISRENSLVGKIEALIRSIATKIRSEQKGEVISLTQEEKNLISMSSIPILKILISEIVVKSGKLSVGEYIESIAFDIVINHIESMLDEVYDAVSRLEHAQIDGSKIESFKNEMRMVRTQLYHERDTVFNRLHTILELKQKSKLIDEHMRTVFKNFSGI